MQRVIKVSPAALTAAAESERFGQLHPALRASAVYVPADDASRQTDELREELKQAGLLEPSGRILADFADFLPPLCTPSISYVGYFSFEDKVRCAFSGATVAMGVVAIREGDTIMMREVGEHELVDALLGELPELTPGTGPLVSVNLDVVRSARGENLQRQVEQNLRALRSIKERPVTETVEIGIAMRDERGNTRQARSQLHIALTDWGHFIAYTLGTGRDEEAWGGPATYENVHKALGQLRSDLVTVG